MIKIRNKPEGNYVQGRLAYYYEKERPYFYKRRHELHSHFYKEDSHSNNSNQYKVTEPKYRMIGLEESGWIGIAPVIVSGTEPIKPGDAYLWTYQSSQLLFCDTEKEAKALITDNAHKKARKVIALPWMFPLEILENIANQRLLFGSIVTIEVEEDDVGEIWTRPRPDSKVDMRMPQVPTYTEEELINYIAKFTMQVIEPSINHEKNLKMIIQDWLNKNRQLKS